MAETSGLRNDDGHRKHGNIVPRLGAAPDFIISHRMRKHCTEIELRQILIISHRKQKVWSSETRMMLASAMASRDRAR